MATETIQQMTAAGFVDVADLVPIWQTASSTTKNVTVGQFMSGSGAALLSGRLGGQILKGGTAPTDTLNLVASSNAAPTGNIAFLGGATGSTELGHMTNGGQLVWNGPLVVTGTSNLFGNVSTSGSLTAASITATNLGTFNNGKTFVGPGIIAEGGNGGITFTASELGVPAVVNGVTVGANVACCADLRGGRCDTSGNSVLNVNGDMVARFMFAGSCRPVTTPAHGPKLGVASINAFASENWTDAGGANPTPLTWGSRLEFWTTPNGTGTNHGQLAMTLDNDASLTVVGPIIGPSIKTVSATSGVYIIGTGGPQMTASGTSVNFSGGIIAVAATLTAATSGVFILGTGGPQILTNTMSPVVGPASAGTVAPVGSLYLQTSGVTATTTLWVKTGTAATAWTNK